MSAMQGTDEEKEPGGAGAWCHDNLPSPHMFNCSLVCVRVCVWGGGDTDIVFVFAAERLLVAATTGCHDTSNRRGGPCATSFSTTFQIVVLGVKGENTQRQIEGVSPHRKNKPRSSHWRRNTTCRSCCRNPVFSATPRTSRIMRTECKLTRVVE